MAGLIRATRSPPQRTCEAGGRGGAAIHRCLNVPSLPQSHTSVYESPRGAGSSEHIYRLSKVKNIPYRYIGLGLGAQVNVTSNSHWWLGSSLAFEMMAGIPDTEENHFS